MIMNFSQAKLGKYMEEKNHNQIIVRFKKMTEI